LASAVIGQAVARLLGCLIRDTGWLPFDGRTGL